MNMVVSPGWRFAGTATQLRHDVAVTGISGFRVVSEGISSLWLSVRRQHYPASRTFQHLQFAILAAADDGERPFELDFVLEFEVWATNLQNLTNPGYFSVLRSDYLGSSSQIRRRLVISVRKPVVL